MLWGACLQSTTAWGEYSRSMAVQAAGPRLTMTQKEKALEEFAEDGWLAAVPGRPGTYSLGVSACPAFLALTLCCRRSLPAGAAC